MDDLDLLLPRLAVIRRIAELAPKSGKTSIQKIMYFIQMWLGVSLGYRFRIHYYGPYSEKLDSNLSLANAMGIVGVKPASNGFGFNVSPGTQSIGNQRLNVEWSEIEQLIHELSSLPIWKLELLATIDFIGRTHPGWSKDEVVAMVRRVKPKFTMRNIEDSYSELPAELK